MVPSIFVLLLSVVFLPIIGILSLTCPNLQPNKNVEISCYTGISTNKLQGREQFQQLNCKNIEVNFNTVVVYQCAKYYKPTARRFNGGKMNCTTNGWTNVQAFRDFRCELDCGSQPSIRTALIETGKPTSPKLWPWVATIYKQYKLGQFSYTCGGTLIGLRTVLTSAHCLHGTKASAYKIVLGSTGSDFEQIRKSSNASVFEVREIFLHPKYNRTNFENDIAIIELEETANLTEIILPVCLPTSFEQDSLVTSPENFGDIASFGSDATGNPANTLQYTKAEIFNAVACHSELNIVPRTDQYCAGNPRGPNICKGDSGSGMYFRYLDTKRYVIHGIISNTENIKNGCGPLVTFQKVFNHIEWIHEIINVAENRNQNGSDSLNSGFVSSVPASLSIIMEYTSAEKQGLAKLRQIVKDVPLERYMYRDEYLIRFLRANDFNLEETIKALKANMEWRKTNNINEIVNEDFTKFWREYTIFNQGNDKEGRPVHTVLVGLWDLTKLAQTRDIKKFERYLIRTLESQEIKARASGNPFTSQCTTIFDFHGFNTKKFLCLQCFSLFLNTMRVYEKYYPQLAYALYFINMPPTSKEAFNVVRPYISHYTLNQIKLYGQSKEIWSRELLKQIPADQLFVAYGGTKTIENGTQQIELALRTGRSFSDRKR